MHIRQLYQDKWNGLKSLNAEKYNLKDMGELVVLPYIYFFTYQFIYLHVQCIADRDSFPIKRLNLISTISRRHS